MNVFPVFLIWFTTMITITPVLDNYFEAGGSETPDDTPFFLRFLGEGRSLISYMSLIQADVYYHSGIYPGILEPDEAHAGGAKKKTGHEGLLVRVSDAINITEHLHLPDNQVKEILPWLYYAAKIDPRNVQAYVLAGYYLAFHLNKIDDAESFLKQGLRNNPYSWEINAELGNLYYEKIHDLENAYKYLRRAESILNRSAHDKFAERSVLTILAVVCERTGRINEESEAYKRLHVLFPDNDTFAEKVNKTAPDKQAE